MSADFVPGNRVRLLETGVEYFPALEQAIAEAQEEIHLETYIFENDTTGRRIADALGAAARRGVKVRILVDGFGSPGFYAELGKRLIGEGAEVLIYRREVTPLRLRRHRLRRLHRKLVVVDGRLGFVGGINIIDDMDTPRQIPPRYDYAVEVEGPVVAHMHTTVRRLWHLMTWAIFRQRTQWLPTLGRPMPNACGDVDAAFVIRNNIGHRRDIEDAYLDAISTARSDITIASAYFLPGRRFRASLADAAARGVKVVVLLQGRVEYRLLHHATQSLYSRLLNGGIRIFEYHRSFLHAKVGVVDGRWATVGSSNIDPFSLLLAREANLVVNNTDFACHLRESLGRATETGATEIRLADLEHRGLLERTLNRVAYTLVRLAISLTHYGSIDYRE